MGACDHFRVENLSFQRIIKEIGRGKSAGDLSRDDARVLFSSILAGQVPELELGAILLSLRVKGESLEEFAGFMAACEASYEHLEKPGTDPGFPVVIPSYNGARVLPNLVPLLALLLAREGVPVLIHGVLRDPGRVATCEVLRALGIAPAASRGEALSQLESRRIAFLPIETLAPSIAYVLSLRTRLGVRNSAHTLAKMLQPFSASALRIVSVTHPAYLTRMREYFTRYDSGALLLRGAEGEAVAHPRREPSIDWAHNGKNETWYGESVRPSLAVRPDPKPRTSEARSGGSEAKSKDDSELPHKDAESTARWIERALEGKAAIPGPIEYQVECCKRALSALADKTS